jgi:adenine deaminase
LLCKLYYPVSGLVSNRNLLEDNGISVQAFVLKPYTLRDLLNIIKISFMALLVIPDLKLSDKGLFRGNVFNFVRLCLDRA